MGEKERDEKERLVEEEAEEEVKEEVTGAPVWLTKIKTNLVKILSYTAGAVVIILISFFATREMVKRYMSAERVREIGGKIVIPPEPPLQTLDMGEFTVSIKGDDEEPHYIRVTIVLGYGEAGGRRADVQTSQELTLRQVQIKHIINMTLASKTVKELETPEDKENLAIELRDRINQILSTGKIKRVFFSSITVM